MKSLLSVITKTSPRYVKLEQISQPFKSLRNWQCSSLEGPKINVGIGTAKVQNISFILTDSV